jgi:cation diffusion facilitator CzcD-associated flavoprotein CzcO
MSETAQVVTLVGGGASAHVLVPFLSGAGHEVQLLTRRPERWSRENRLELQSIDEEVEGIFAGAPRDRLADFDRCLPHDFCARWFDRGAFEQADSFLP